ncbi:voltage-dependent T-type calcium channel subunit alpha-1H-like isoform X2 [Siniperca chuatsi]|uniref:voltage-dependent T-type calcium channel subunit alpha-1H-like isoform X2 n=1 Tax=Siniperca chuatsi TaxID=119488 RepID=UPI001CE0F099|nr:voltage-dependent T-type calcium channel subunit alpha-1H-like isoform X2 [Siniperca chuatsi]
MTDFEGQKEEQPEVALTIPEQGAHNPNCVSTEEEQLPYPDLAPVVWLFLKQTTRPRNWCLQMTCSSWLDNISILMVLLNCVTMGMYKPCGEISSNLQVLEAFIIAFFMVEMLIKMVALGIFGCKGSYLSSNWNKFDFLINLGKVLDYYLDSLGIDFHISQVLRPIRLIGRVPSMRDLVSVLSETVPMLANVLILYIFVIHIFAVVGVQLWAGQLLNRCFLGEDIRTKYNVSLSPYYVSKYGEKYPFICSPDGKNGMVRCHDVPPYKKDRKTCSLAAPQHASAANELVPMGAGATANTCVNWNLYYNVCRAGDRNPQMGAISFDNIAFAWIAIFQAVTLEGWSEIMFYVMDAHSIWSFLFFILVTIVGSFIMINVCAVVIATQFSENMGRDTGEQRAGAVSLTRLKLTCWLQQISRRCSSHFNKVHPIGRGSLRNSSVIQVLKPLKRKVTRTVKSKLFDRVIMFAVLLSILTMAIEHHEQPKKLTHMLQISNIIFTIIFVVEMTLKLIALTWTYFRDRNNIFDFVIVIISLWEINHKADGRLSVLRAFRLLRFVRLVHFLPYLKRQLLVLKRTIQEAAALCGLLLCVIFIFSVLGMYLFGCKFNFRAKGRSGRKHFDSLLWSMVTVFQLLTQEDWNQVLYKAMDATSPWAALYFSAVIVFGKHVLLNVLVGIVVQSFQARRTTSSNQDCGSDNSTPTNLTHSQTDDSKTNDPSRPILHHSLSRPGPSRSTMINSAPKEDSAPTDIKEDNRSVNLIHRVRRWCKEHEESSFYVFSPQNRFRICCQRVISHKMFDHVILLFILLSCVTIALERPGLDPDGMELWILDMSGYVFSAVFLVEMLLKVLALGLLFGKESYCRSSWNVVDGLLVILSLVHISVSLANKGKHNKLGILKVLRLLRTLRPLRVIKRAPKLKLAVEALMASVKPIGNIVFISCAFLFFFGIFGVQLFKGKFYYCVGEDTRNIINKTDCLSANYRWLRKEYNFDNLPQALISLFVMYSKDGWVNIMYDGLDAVGVDQQPQRNHNEWMLLYFISFMLMSFLLLDMFIGVMVETFHQCQQEQKRRRDGGLLEEGGEVLQDQCSNPEQMPYYTHYSPMRRSIHTLCTSNFLDLFMTVVIFISVLMMAFEHYNQPSYIAKLTAYSYYVFTAILIIEVLLKLVAFGVLRFIKISWNLLDVAVVLVSIISIIFTEMKIAYSFPINPSILRVCRVLRLAQVLKAKKIRVLLKTIIKTLSQVGNICLLFMFFFFIYAVLGVELFSRIECNDDHPCLGLNRHTNFRHFGMALLTLYQVCTGDNWSGIMKDTLRECHPHDEHCLAYLPWVSPIIFTSFVVMAQFVLVNLVVAAIMQALDDSLENKPTHCCLPQEVELQDAKRAMLSQGKSDRSSSSHGDAEEPSEHTNIQK